MALATGLPRSGSAAGSTTATVDPTKDPRLARRVSVASEGMPVSRVLVALTEATGVKLYAAGRVGDQRLVAFVPGTTLADVMTSIAELFRLEWATEGPRHDSYTLFKSLSAAKEETGLRERALRSAFDALAARARVGGLTEKELKETALPEIAQAAPLLLPLVSGNLELLIREGFVYIPLARLPAPVLERLTTSLQPAFDRHNALVKQIQERINAERGASGKPGLSLGGADAPPTVARDCTLTAEFRFKGTPTVWIGLRDLHSAQYTVLQVPGDDLEAAGMGLLRGRTLWPAQDEPQVGSPLARGERLDRMVTVPADPKMPQTDWISRLRQLSEASDVALYTDCYANFDEGMDGHPRGRFVLPKTTSLAAALDRFCRVPNRGARPASLHSYWWFFRGAALVRSRRWLWDEEAVLPADLMERLAASIRETGRPSPRELPGLARLTGAQIQGNGFAEGHLDAWAYSVRLASRLSPPSQLRLFGDGLEWQHLSAPEQEFLLRQLPPAGAAGPNRYSARFTSRPEVAMSQGATLLQTEVSAQWGDVKSQAGLQLPVPGITAKGLPRPEALVVRKLE